MKKSLIYLASFFIMMFSSCKKNELPPDEDSGSPMFYFKCDVNGEPINVEAGKNDYYMNASHYQENNGVYVYKAELKRKDCNSGCGYGLSILINDNRSSAMNASMQPDSGLTIGNHEYNDGNIAPIGYWGIFQSNMPTTTKFTWSYTGASGTTVSLNDYLRDSAYFVNNKTYSVALNVNNFGCVASHTNIFNIGKPMQCNINVIKEQSNQFKFSATTSMPAQSYLWEFGDGTTSTAASPSHTYTLGQYITATLTVSSGSNSCISYYQVPAYANSVCQANYTSTFVPVPNTKALSTIQISLTDPSGKVFTLNELDQLDGNKFEVISVEQYKANESGNSTKKMKVKFNCSLKNGNNTIHITNGEAVIAVSYK